MKVALTGATGLLGANLAYALVEDGHELVCTRRKTSRVDHLGELPVEWVEAALDQPEALALAFGGCEAVFHCAAAVSVQRRVTPGLRATNVLGTRHVMQAVRRAGVGRLIHCSSVGAVGVASGSEPATEETEWNLPQVGLDDGYSVSKRESELEVLAAARDGLDVVVVNPAYMFGPYDVKPSSGELLLAIVRGEVPGWSDGANNFVDARAVARGMIQAWQKGRQGERYILSGRNLPYRDLMELVASLAGGGVSPPRRRMPHWLATLAGWGGDLTQVVSGREALLNTVKIRWGYCSRVQFSCEKARRELGYNPGSLEDAIRDALSWFREHGMLERRASPQESGAR